MTRIYSYVVRYDSGFAPNPFYGYCTLATCKPRIRRGARVGDWVIGCGSSESDRSGYLVYCMRISEILTFDEYDNDPRFQSKKPFRPGSHKQNCGDNIYYQYDPAGAWQQRDSFHSHDDGSTNYAHVQRDTGVNRVLISDQFVYFGGEGPVFPEELQDKEGSSLCKRGRGERIYADPSVVADLAQWMRNLKAVGLQGEPSDWLSSRRR